MSSFQVYKYQHSQFGPIMLLLDHDQPEIEDNKKRNQQFSQNKRRGHTFRPPLPNDKKSLQKSQPKSNSRKKSIQNGVTLPNIGKKGILGKK